MKANEIRLGNYYDHNGEYRQVTPSVIEEVWNAERTWCKPIPLTEEWLIKMGFNRSGLYYHLNDVYIHTMGIFEPYFYYQYNGKECIIESLHQLQNLFYCLCGEELTIKN